MEQRPTRTGGSWLARRMRGVGFAVRGLRAQVTSEPHAKIHLVATIAAVALGFWLRIEAWEWCAVLGAMGLVWVSEGINSALETLADHVAPEWHAQVGRAKDLAAGAVLSASIIAVAIGAIVFGPHLF